MLCTHRHFTREALPRLDNYRNILSIQAGTRPTLEELHNATIVNKVSPRIMLSKTIYFYCQLSKLQTQQKLVIIDWNKVLREYCLRKLRENICSSNWRFIIFKNCHGFASEKCTAEHGTTMTSFTQANWFSLLWLESKMEQLMRDVIHRILSF